MNTRPTRKMSTEPPLDFWIQEKPIESKQHSLMEYYYKHDYDRHVSDIVSAAKKYFGDLKQQTTLPSNAAVVFDVDDTLVCTNQHKRHDNLPEHFYPPIDHVCDLYGFLFDHGFKLLILTGRYNFVREITEQNLLWIGISGWEELVLREEHEKNLPAFIYKSARRKDWSKNYSIMGNIGDQYSDLVGGNSGYAVKLPNVMYTIQ